MLSRGGGDGGVGLIEGGRSGGSGFVWIEGGVCLGRWMARWRLMCMCLYSRLDCWTRGCQQIIPVLQVSSTR